MDFDSNGSSSFSNDSDGPYIPTQDGNNYHTW